MRMFGVKCKWYYSRAVGVVLTFSLLFLFPARAFGRYKPLTEYNEKKQLVSFDDYREMKERMREFIETFERIEPSEYEIAEKDDDNLRDNGKSDKRFGVLFLTNEAEDTVLLTITNNVTSDSFTIVIRTQAHIEEEPVTVDNGIDNENSDLLQATHIEEENPESETDFSKVTADGTDAHFIDNDDSEVRGINDRTTKFYVGLFDSAPDRKNGFDEDNEMVFSSSEDIIDYIDRILEEMYGFFDDDNGLFVEGDENLLSPDVEMRLQSSNITVPHVKSWNRYSKVRKDIAVLLKAYRSAIKRFYSDVQPYYSKLESELKKAQWLWRERGIDPHLYYAGADGVLDYRELRQMVEESIAYLYEVSPIRKDKMSDKERLLILEEGLRREYLDPSFELYKDELKEASLVFYEAVEKTLHPLGNPYFNELGEDVEIIITLPRNSQ